MGRKSKLNLSSLFFKPNAGGDSISSSSSSPSSSSSSSSSWAWPSCKQQPRTDSFRSGPDTTTTTTTNNNNNVYKTINSVYFDTTTTDSSSDALSIEDSDESMIRRLVRSDRLFFEPGTRTSSILEDPGPLDNYSCKGFSIPATAMEMESEDPYGDFRRSMEEMVAANEEMREWESLEQLLVWYLRVNGKRNHGFIVGAFVDLLVALAASCDDDGGGGDEGKETGACCDSAATSVRFEIEEVEEGSGSC